MQDQNQQIHIRIGGNKDVVCEKCAGPLGTEVVRSGSWRLWHAECLICYNCRNPLTSGWFYSQNKSIFCERCYTNMYCPRCAECSRPIKHDGSGVKAMEVKFHQHCFTCQICRTTLNRFYAIFKKRPTCLECYQKQADTTPDKVDKDTFHHLTHEGCSAITPRLAFDNNDIPDID